VIRDRDPPGGDGAHRHAAGDRIAPQPTQFAIGRAVEGLRGRGPRPGAPGGRSRWRPGRRCWALAGAPVRLADLRATRCGSASGRAGVRPARTRHRSWRDTFNAYRDRGLALVAVSVQESTVDDVRGVRREVRARLHDRPADLAGDVFRRYRHLRPSRRRSSSNAAGSFRAVVQDLDTPDRGARSRVIGLPVIATSRPHGALHQARPSRSRS